MRLLLTCVFVSLQAARSSAQFDQFDWTLKGNPSGFGSVTPSLMHVTGPDNCGEFYTTTWFETVLTYPASISILVDFTPLDSPCDVFDAPTWVVDGEANDVDGFWCAGTYEFSFEVAPGQPFGFGIWSMDCAFGPGLGDFHDLVVTPHEWWAVGAALDPQIGPEFAGDQADRLGDVDGDGQVDFVTALQGGVDKIQVWSGLSGSLVLEIEGDEGLGHSLAGVGDMDGDGVADIVAGTLVGGVYPQESVHAFSGLTGAELFKIKGAAKFGSELAGPGDLDGDGLADVAVRTNILGEQVHLLGGPDGHLIGTVGSSTSGQGFGAALAGAGDVDLDGVPDLAIGIPSQSLFTMNVGTARVHSGASLALIHEFKGEDKGFGADVDFAGDLDGDGTPDLLVADASFKTGSTSVGAVFAYSGQTGSDLFQVEGVPGVPLGASVEGGTDLTGDGQVDFVTVTNTAPASVHVRDAQGEIHATITVPTTELGAEVEILGNVDGAGTEDIALVGGGVHVLKALDGLGPPHLEGRGVAAGNELVELALTHGLAGATGLLVLGGTSVQLPLLGGVLQPQPEVLVPVAFGLDGSASLTGRWPSGLPQHSTIWFQAWIADPAGPQGWTCTNGLVATQLGN